MFCFVVAFLNCKANLLIISLKVTELSDADVHTAYKGILISALQSVLAVIGITSKLGNIQEQFIIRLLLCFLILVSCLDASTLVVDA